MKINIETIPQKDHRPEAGPTVGDYWVDKDGSIQIRISEMKSADYEVLVLMHELTELFLCAHNGVRFEDIDKFDSENPDLDYPGDEPLAPYQNEHNFATAVERMLCAAMGVKWQEYDDYLLELIDGKS